MTAERSIREIALRKLRDLAPVLRERGIARADMFGSVARDAATGSSDIDLIVELSRPLGFAFFELEQFVADQLGMPVELSTRASMRPRVLAQAERDLVRVF
jgi:predicted nucleotidyltransferase